MSWLDALPLEFMNLWALALLGLVPLLVLLYFLRLKRPQVKVPSTLLWQKVIEEMRVNAPFQRLKKSLLLLLQLLLLLALVFALARPWLKARAGAAESLIVMLDVSASMQAVEPGGKTRLALAKKEIAGLIDDLHPAGEMMLLTFDTRATTVCSFTNNRKRLRQALDDIRATDCPTSVNAALRVAESVSTTRPKPRVILFSDGAFPDPGKPEVPVEYRRTGTPQSNLAITGMDVRRSLRDPQKIEMFIGAQNFSDQPYHGTLTVHLDDKLLDSRAFDLEPQKVLSQIFEARLPGTGILRVGFEAADALPLDNRAEQVVPEPRHRRVLLVADNPFYLEKALRSSPEVEVTSIAPADFPAYATKGFQTVIWSNVDQPQVAAGNNVYFGCAPAIDGLKLEGKSKAPDVVDWNNAHPLTRFIDFSNLVVSEAGKLTFPPDAEIVVTGTEGPLVGCLERGGDNLVVGGFDIFKSSWPFQVSFVLFLQNCLNFFDERQAIATSSNVAVGGTLTAPDQPRPPQVKTPEGTTYEMAKVSGGGYSFSGVDRCGIYEISGLADGSVRRMAANLFNREESTLTPADNPIAEGKAKTTGEATRKVSREYFRLLLVVVLALLVFEWLVYHRRILS